MRTKSKESSHVAMSAVIVILALLMAKCTVEAGTEPINVSTTDGKVKQTSSGVGAIGKPFDFTNVFTIGIGGGGGGTPGGLTTQVQRNNAGAFGGITNATSDGTTLTMTSPKIITAINDTNANKILSLLPTASAVNYLELQNATAGSPTVILNGTGTSADVNLRVIPKGSGTVALHTAAADLTVGSAAITADVGSGFTIGQGSTDTPLTLLGAGTGTGNKAVFSIANIAGSTTRTVNIAGTANSTTVAPDVGASNNFLTSVSANGVIAKAQPDFSNLSGNWTLAQGPSVTASRLLGRTNASAGIPQEITLGTNLSMSGTTVNAAGTSPGGSNTQVQYNNAGAFGGITNATTDGTTLTLTSPKIDGTVGSTSTGLWPFQKNQAALTGIQIQNNSNTGTADTFIYLYADNVSGGFEAFPTTFANAEQANKLWCTMVTGNEMSFVTAVNSPISFYTGGTAATNKRLAVSGTGVISTQAANVIGWASGTTPGTNDTGLARNAAGVVEINNGTAGTFKDLKADHVNAVTGFQVNGAASSGKILIGNGTNYVASTPTYPNAASTALKWLRSDGTNFITSTSTLSDTPSTAGKVVVSDGTNWITSTPTFPNASASAGKFIRSDGTNWIASTPTLPTAAGTAGKILSSDATNYIESVPTFPTSASATSGKMIQSDGTNWVASTATWPTANTAGYKVQGNGTNYVAYPTGITNTSVTSVTTAYASDTYLAGSAVTVAAGDWKVNGVYHCRFDMVKTGAGTQTPIITVRMGTLGSTSDAAVGTITFAVGTGVIDTGVFDVDVVFRTVGSGTSAVVQMMGTCAHHLAATGLTTTGASGVGIIVGTSSGFASTTQTKLGLSFNGGTSFSGTNTIVTAKLDQP